jgi:hypothetical protein
MASSTSVLTGLVGGTGLLLLAPEETNFTGLWGQPTAPTAFVATPLPAPAVWRGLTRGYLLIGEGATLRGVAKQVQEAILTPATGAVWGAVSAAEVDLLGAALYRVATEMNFGAAVPLSGAEVQRHWTVGTLFPLPVWATVDVHGVTTWHVDVAKVTAALAAVPPLISTERDQATIAARPLHRFDPVDDPTPVPGNQRFAAAMAGRDALRTLVTGSPTGTAPAATFNATTEGQRLAAEARWNPYTVLFRMAETLLTFDAITSDPAQKAQITGLGTGYWGALTGPERVVSLSTSAGYAIARQLWMWWHLAGAPDATLKAALGLADDDLAKRQPANEGILEPPMVGHPALPVPTLATNKKSLPIMAFGRRVAFTGQHYPLAGPVFFGIGFAGDVGVSQYLIPAPGDPLVRPFSAALLPAGTPAQQAATKDQWFRILSAISATEGALDASSAWDSAMCSLGFQQWSMHIATEGPGLLERLKWLSPSYYDLVVRTLAIETGRRGVAGPTTDGADVGDLDADSCFYTLSAGAAPAQHLVPADSDTAANKLTFANDVRRNVFDWTKASTKWTAGRRAMLLAARWSVAARYSVEMWQAQAELAVNRIRRADARLRRPSEVAAWAPVLALANLPKFVPPPAGPPRAPTPQELFGTEALMAAAIDMAINTPEHFTAAMRRAVARAVAVGERDGLVPQPPAAATIDAAFQLLLFITFMNERRWKTLAHSARGAAIDVAPGRVGGMLNIAGTLRDRTPPDVLPAPLPAMLRGFGISRDAAISLAHAVSWP